MKLVKYFSHFLLPLLFLKQLLLWWLSNDFLTPLFRVYLLVSKLPLLFHLFIHSFLSVGIPGFCFYFTSYTIIIYFDTQIVLVLLTETPSNRLLWPLNRSQPFFPSHFPSSATSHCSRVLVPFIRE